jgi:hypothetical protein
LALDNCSDNCRRTAPRTAPVFFGALRAGTARPGPQSAPQSKAAQLAALNDLLKTGALTQDEFDNEKRKILES